ncbi:MAG: glycoside hydrolase family 2 TIM barrel-domain containing protein [Rouxiella aceris]|uniref:glycoside hydrolase family 2 TIM barrel-domain containing protein n=1 Tax=Rouxiella aceris TaxID=2703884 RepID=UPI00284C2972|nr:glycoside hydrolase family 2 TIM barrel-domain containing protein [Rouxiella aceris]MDR3430766.1 glycoside hydrolase family 2 TIM barrel-domain containing protein [Rouxiella aceris]
MQQKSNFKKTTLAISISLALTLAIGLSACGGGDSQDSNAPIVSTSQLRTTTSLNNLDWKFVQDDNITDDAALSSDTSAWTTVQLPHTWNANDAATTAQTTPDTASYKRGKGWYQVEFDAPGNGATQWLQFDGASIVADVWLNGEKLGEHAGAFTAFRFDITGKLKAGKNVLMVKTDNSQALSDTDLTAIIPLSGDFNMSGGLYRGVSLVSTPSSAHFALDDLGSSGIFAYTSSVEGASATVNVRAKLKNDTKADGNFAVRAALVDAAGQVVRYSDQSVSIKAGQAAEVAQDLSVANAHLWNGLADPYLYKLVVELKDSSGSVVDRVVQDYGIREVKFDPDKGFYLNGKSVPLHGVSMHQDYLGKGWAISNADTDESLSLIKEIGANTIRLPHYPHAQYTLQQTDKMGFVVWAENAYVNQSSLNCAGNTSVTSPTQLTDNAKLQLRELIRQQYNHASIAMWSIGNETTQGCYVDAGPDRAAALLKELQIVAKAEDPSRVTTLAANRDQDKTSGITDIWAQNQYFMWYTNEPAANLGTLLDLWHTNQPKQPQGVSEYGAGAAISHHSDNVSDAMGSVSVFDVSGRTRTQYQPEEYASYVHEQVYPVLASREYIWGTYVWNMFDFGSGIRHEGDIGGTNTKGLVTFDRKTKKDPFFYYKAQWSKDPVAYIVGRRYIDRNYPTAGVKVYSNTDSVTLTLNGTAVKTMTAAQCSNKVCDFGDIKLATGNNVLETAGTLAGKTVKDIITWKLDSDHASNMYIAAGQSATGFISEAAGALGVAKRFGSDNYYTGGVRKTLPWGNAVGQASGPLVNVGTSSVPAAGRVWDAYREEATAGQGFSYNLDLAPNKTYTVKLGFLEVVNTAANQRVFDVTATANGATTTVISSLDVYAQTGAKGAAYVQSFTVTTGADGKLNLGFVGKIGKAMVSNIMIVQQ